MKDLQENAKKKKISTQGGDSISYCEYYASKSKPIIDEIDRVLAEHYGFTDEELDFIINYDIKYRMGLKTSFEENSSDLLKLAAKVYEGLSDDDLDDMEEIIHDRHSFFGDRTP